jgi:hypothetical protein
MEFKGVKEMRKNRSFTEMVFLLFIRLGLKFVGLGWGQSVSTELLW